jgi:hypothetical protein
VSDFVSDHFDQEELFHNSLSKRSIGIGTYWSRLKFAPPAPTSLIFSREVYDWTTLRAGPRIEHFDLTGFIKWL